VPRTAVCALLLASLALSGCSLKASDDESGGAVGGAPASGVEAGDEQASEQLGFPIVATRNTTRVSGSDPVADAAGVASALYPATEAASRPRAVVLADKDDWHGIVAAGALAAAPVQAPILLSDGDDLPAVTSETLDRLDPRGITVPTKAEVIVVGDAPTPEEIRTTVIKSGDDPYERAAAVDRFASLARGKPSATVVVASGERPEYAVPAAAWAGRSGDAVLFVTEGEIPDATADALEQHEKPDIYLLGPESVISEDVEDDLGEYGDVRRVGTDGAVENAIEFASFNSGDFGWGPIAPGGNYTVANTDRPGDAAGAAGLGGNGIFAPLLLTDSASALPRSLEGFFLDVQPGYYEDTDPRQSVYNHVWILGGTSAVSAEAQGRLDSATALVTIDEEPAR
jgi:ell wall binding domain 2 (CWB2)